MKAEELMINDLVRYEDSNVRVSMLDEVDGVIRIWSGDEDMGLTIADCVKPIRITVEILETNGFQLFPMSPSHYMKFEKGNIIECHPRESYWVYERGCATNDGRIDTHLRFTYVHELQHALRLCGLNDLANNFKIN